MATLTKIVLNTDTIPRVDIDFMNNTHFEEIEMVQVLGDFITAYQQSALPTERDIDKLTELLENWLHHTEAHFERENLLMRQTFFPAYLIHSGEHELALEQMAGMVKSWQDKHDIELLAEYVFTTWPDWFNGHVDSMDMITARFAVMNGFDPNSLPQEKD